MMELLLEHDADINSFNNDGDTPLHKAAFIGREVRCRYLFFIITVLKSILTYCLPQDLVLLLLERGASVNVINGEGQTPRDVAERPDICKLLLGAEQTDARRREEELLTATREGNLDMIDHLVSN